MANDKLYDITSLGEEAKNRSKTIPVKVDADLFPTQLTLKCGSLEIISDGTPQRTKILIDKKEARGIYSLKIAFNSQRMLKVEVGAFADYFNFDLRPRGEK